MHADILGLAKLGNDVLVGGEGEAVVVAVAIGHGLEGGEERLGVGLEEADHAVVREVEELVHIGLGLQLCQAET